MCGKIKNDSEINMSRIRNIRKKKQELILFSNYVYITCSHHLCHVLYRWELNSTYVSYFLCNIKQALNA